jgi:hypothetical protein
MEEHDYKAEFENHIRKVSAALGRELDMDKIQVIDRGVPHCTPKWRDGLMAVYTYNFQGEFLKIGKAGPRSEARFRSHHYNPHNAKSTLAASILSDPKMSGYSLNDKTVGNWIKEHCRRIDVMIPVNMGIFTLELVEAILHYVYEPRYEGFDSQR